MPVPSPAGFTEPGAVPRRRLAQLLSAYARHDGAVELRLPGTFAVRASRASTEPIYATLGPCLCVVAQGAKVVMLGRDVFEKRPRPNAGVLASSTGGRPGNSRQCGVTCAS